MALFLIIAVSVIALGLLWWLGRLSRGALSITGAALALGLVGYALQGSPNLPGAPVAAKPDVPSLPVAQDADVKGALLGKVGGEAETLAQADAYFRINRPELAARVLRLAIDKHPESPALWTGLGNAMVAHDRGLLSPAAEYCYKKALRLVPGYPGTLYFYAVALAENDRVQEAKPLFAELIARMPADAPMRKQLVQDLQKAGLLEGPPRAPAK